MASTDRLRFIGATDGDFDKSANWIVHSGTPAAGTPSLGEGVVFGAAINPLTNGPAASLALNNGTVLPAYSIAFGGPGAAIGNLSFNSGTDPFFRYAGQCPEFFLDANSLSLLIVDSSTQPLVFSTGTITDARISGARLGITNSCHAPLIRARNSTINVDKHTTSTNRLDQITLFNSALHTYRDVDVGTQIGKRAQFLGDAAVTDGSTGGLFTVASGRLEWWSEGSPRVEGISGSMSFGRAPKNVTIAHLVRWADFVVSEIPEGLEVTIPADEIRVGPTGRIAELSLSESP